jgi:DNA-binding response OmpR family regulator
MARILVVDDEQDLLWALSRSLSTAGHEILMARTGSEALALARRHRPDLVILDIMIPQPDGLEVCRRLRTDPVLADVPILFLTARRSVEDRLRGLEDGGDDYLIKPFDIRELRARVAALLRRTRGGPQPPPRELVVGDVRLDPAVRQVFAHGKCVQLTPLEFDLLYHLMAHPGELFSSQELLRVVWGHAPGSRDYGLVRWHMMHLRQKIEADPNRPEHLKTVPRHGYVFAAPGH